MASSEFDDFTAQDLARCNICGWGAVSLYCTFCSSELCKHCSTDHILSDPLNRHEVIAYTNKDLDPPHITSNIVCPCPKCRTGVEAGQETDSLSEALKQKLRLLSREAKQIQSQKIPEMLRQITEMEKQIAEVQEIYKVRFKDIVSQGQQCRVAINELEEEYRTRLDLMKERDLRELLRQQEHFEILITRAKQKLEHHEASDILQMETFQFPDFSFPKPLQWTAPTFVPIKVDKELVRSWFGTLKESTIQAHPEEPRPLSTTSNKSSEATIQRYRPNICKCDRPIVLKSIVTGERKCGKCKKYIK